MRLFKIAEERRKGILEIINNQKFNWSWEKKYYHKTIDLLRDEINKLTIYHMVNMLLDTKELTKWQVIKFKANHLKQ